VRGWRRREHLYDGWRGDDLRRGAPRVSLRRAAGRPCANTCRRPRAQPANLLRRYSVRIDLVAPEPHTSEHLLDALSGSWDLSGARVLLQHAGVPNPWLRSELTNLGSRVFDISTYRCEPPADGAAVVRLAHDLIDGRVDVLVVTCAPQIDNLLDIADDHGLLAEPRDALRRVPIAVQGDLCASAVVAHGLPVSIVPRNPTMGSLVLALADHFSGLPAARLRDDVAGAVVAVVGSRAYRALDEVRSYVEALPMGTTIVTCGSRGVDRAEQASLQHGLAVRVVSHAAPAARDERLVRTVDRVVAFLDGESPGTRRLIGLAQQYAKPVEVIRPRS
jgi:hypothetical protein